MDIALAYCTWAQNHGENRKKTTKFKTYPLSCIFQWPRNQKKRFSSEKGVRRKSFLAMCPSNSRSLYQHRRRLHLRVPQLHCYYHQSVEAIVLKSEARVCLSQLPSEHAYCIPHHIAFTEDSDVTPRQKLVPQVSTCNAVAEDVNCTTKLTFVVRDLCRNETTQTVKYRTVYVWCK